MSHFQFANVIFRSYSYSQTGKKQYYFHLLCCKYNYTEELQVYVELFPHSTIARTSNACPFPSIAGGIGSLSCCQVKFKVSKDSRMLRNRTFCIREKINQTQTQELWRTFLLCHSLRYNVC